MKLENERFKLRHITLEDAEDIFEYATDPDTGPRAGWQPHKNIEETRNLIKYWLSVKLKDEEFVVVHKQDNKVIGTMGVTFYNISPEDSKSEVIDKLMSQGKKCYEIGITLSKKYWGKNIATETLGMMIDYLFEDRQADLVVTAHFEENIGSKRAQEKNNMKVLYTMQREEKWYNTNCNTMVVRAKTREEWLAEKENELEQGE